MENEKSAFIQKLDELIELFEKLKAKATSEGIIRNDDPLYANFDLLANNYRLIKNNLPNDLLEEIGEPIKDVITQMIEQLKKEMGESETTKSDPLFRNHIEEIDKMLKDNNISEEEINRLLDERSKLI